MSLWGYIPWARKADWAGKVLRHFGKVDHRIPAFPSWMAHGLYPIFYR